MDSFDKNALRLLVSRLRLLQSELADQSPRECQIRISEEIEQAVSQLRVEARAPFLDALAVEFPIFDQVIGNGDGGSPAAIAEKLVASLRSADPRERGDVLRRLAEAGLVPTMAMGDPTMRALLTRLRLPEHFSADSARVAALLAAFIEFAIPLDDWSRGVWNVFSRDQQAARPLNDIISRYLSDPNVSRAKAELDQRLPDIMRRVKALVATLRALPQRHAEKFAPHSIDRTVGATILRNRGAVCWEKYASMCGGQDIDTLAYQVEEMITLILDGFRGSAASNGPG